MRKLVKFGGLAVGVGAVIGFGTVGWMQAHRVAAEPVVHSGVAGGLALNNTGENKTVPLDTSPTRSATPGLAVVTDGNQGSVLGESSGMQGSAATPTPAASDQLPGPSEFGVYDQYKDHSTALYIDVQPGTGKAVAQGSVVTLQYTGWLTNGTEFDATQPGKSFQLTEGDGKVIPGFAEAIFGMKAGGERRLVIPPSQGYGATTQGPVPANSVLVFDIKLISVQ